MGNEEQKIKRITKFVIGNNTFIISRDKERQPEKGKTREGGKRVYLYALLHQSSRLQ